MSRAVNQYRVYCETEAAYVYVWGTSAPTACPHASTDVLDMASLSVVDTIAENAQTLSGVWSNGGNFGVSVTTENKLAVDVPISAFGLLKVQEDFPEVQIDFRHGLSSRITSTSTAGGGTVSAADCLVSVSSGAAPGGSATLTSLRSLRYAGGQGGNVMFTALYTPGAAGTTQLMGCGSSDHGFFFGYDGALFGVLHRKDSQDTWVHQAAWNIDRMDGQGPSSQALNLHLGNVYRVSFQWLGFGMITFMVEEMNTGRFVPVHRICYANASSLPTITDPSFAMFVQATNDGGASDVTVRSACFCAMLEGTPSHLGLTFSADNTKTISDTSLTSILTLRSKATLAAETAVHYIPVSIKMLSIAVDGTSNCIVHLILDATLGGTPSFSDVETDDSVVAYDTNGTSVGGGSQLASFVIGKSQSRDINVSSLNLILQRGQSLTFATKLAAGTGSTDVTLSVTWQEDR